MQNKLYKTLKKVKKILHNKFFLSGGQVLGAFREGKFLENEHDIDLGIFDYNIDSIINYLDKKKIKYEVRKINFTNIKRAIKFKINGVGIDIFIYRLIRNNYYAVTHDNKLGFIFHKFPNYIFDDLVLLAPYKKLGNEKYYLPAKGYLDCEYGNWKKIIKKWNCCENPPCIDKKIYLGGIFDLFHIGHLNLLKKARKLGGILFVSVLTDKAAEKYKRKPIIPYKQRVKIIEEFADVVMPQTDVDETKNGFIDVINPDVIVHGDDKLPNSYNWAIINKKKTIQLPYTKNQSTTKIINKILRNKNAIR